MNDRFPIIQEECERSKQGHVTILGEILAFYVCLL